MLRIDVDSDQRTQWLAARQLFGGAHRRSRRQQRRKASSLARTRV
ncbi:MAG: hypothetical protein U0168_11010 [Nannocystaceae bacterium]